MHAAPPPKKGMSGCLLALLIVGGLFLVGSIGGGIWLYSEFGEFMGATKEMAEVVIDSQNAPGTKEMKDVGCDEAMALDIKKLMGVMERFEKEIAKRENRKPKPMDLDVKEAQYALVCKVKLGDAPSCDKIAKAYADATSPDGNFIVSVEKLGSAKCAERFDPKGKSLGKADHFQVPQTQ